MSACGSERFRAPTTQRGRRAEQRREEGEGALSGPRRRSRSSPEGSRGSTKISFLTRGAAPPSNKDGSRSGRAWACTALGLPPRRPELSKRLAPSQRSNLRRLIRSRKLIKEGAARAEEKQKCWRVRPGVSNPAGVRRAFSSAAAGDLTASPHKALYCPLCRSFICWSAGAASRVSPLPGRSSRP